MLIQLWFGDAWKKKDYGAIIGGTLLAIVVFGPVLLLEWAYLIRLLHE